MNSLRQTLWETGAYHSQRSTGSFFLNASTESSVIQTQERPAVITGPWRRFYEWQRNVWDVQLWMSFIISVHSRPHKLDSFLSDDWHSLLGHLNGPAELKELHSIGAWPFHSFLQVKLINTQNAITAFALLCRLFSLGYQPWILLAIVNRNVTLQMLVYIYLSMLVILHFACSGASSTYGHYKSSCWVSQSDFCICVLMHLLEVNFVLILSYVMLLSFLRGTLGFKSNTPWS